LSNPHVQPDFLDENFKRAFNDFVQLGETVEIGSCLFTASAIEEFSRKYKLQPSSFDERGRPHGKLSALGWHVAAEWMRCYIERQAGTWKGSGPAPQFGPSPGMRNLTWPKPVFAGDTVKFSRTVTGYGPMAKRPGWVILKMKNEGSGQLDDLVLSFESAVLVRTN
jgi:acyl dehydratase